jgi:hypothetical protein
MPVSNEQINIRTKNKTTAINGGITKKPQIVSTNSTSKSDDEWESF